MEVASGGQRLQVCMALGLESGATSSRSLLELIAGVNCVYTGGLGSYKAF